MAIEHEIKLLGIDVDGVTAFFKSIGVAKESSLFFKRNIFETVDQDKDAWIRLRTDGNKTTLTYKKSVSNAVDGMIEIEIIVNDYDDTRELLQAAGLKIKSYQENKREIYQWLGCEISIDYWPQIPAYLEIEGSSIKVVEKCLKELEKFSKKTTSLSTEKVYDSYGIDLTSIAELKF